MSLPLKKHNTRHNNQSTLNPQYLNFIRKNHYKFETQQKLIFQNYKTTNKQTPSPQNAFDDKNQFYQLHSQKRLIPMSTIQQQTKKINKQQIISYDQSQITKNYKTIDIVPDKNHKKYLSLGQHMIVPSKKQFINGSNKYMESNKYLEGDKKLENQQNLINNHQIKQTLLQNQRFIELLQRKNKQIADKLRLNSQKNQKDQEKCQTPQFLKQTPRINNIHRKQRQEDHQKKYKSSAQANNQPKLKLKKQNMRDLWKQKFLNHSNNIQQQRYQNKKPKSQLRFPIIFNGKQGQKKQSGDTNQQRVNKSVFSQYQDLSLDQCNIVTKVTKYKPESLKEDKIRNCLINNQSLQLLSRQSLQLEKQLQIQKSTQNYLKNAKLNKIFKRQSSLVNVQGLTQNTNIKPHNQALNNNQIEFLRQKNSQMSIIKRRRNVPQKITNFLTSTDPLGLSKDLDSSRSKHKKNHKQLARQKQKQFQKYLIDNSILKSAKIVNYYQKQQQKKKVIFNQLQKKNYLQSKQSLIVQLLNERQLLNHNNSHKFNKQQKQSQQKSILQRQNSKNSNNYDEEYEQDLLQKDLIQDKQQFTPVSSSVITISNNSNSNDQSFHSNSNLMSMQKSLSPQKKKNVNLNFLKKDSQLSIYQIKIRSYRQFLFMMNLAYKIFLPLNLKPASEFKNQIKFTYFIGKGNNRLLIKSLMNRRFWWEETKDQFKANFVWTQLKVNDLYQFEKSSDYLKLQNRFDKNQSNQIEQIKKKKKVQSKLPPKAGFYKAPLPASIQMKIFSKADRQIYQNIVVNMSQNPQNALNFNNRLKYIPTQNFNITKTQQDLHKQKVHNHLQNNYFIGNKKALFYNISNYYKLVGKNPFQIIPFTLHIKKGVQDPAYNQFLKEYKKIAKQQSNSLKNIWIVKPGQLSNRGQGITVIDQVYELNNILKKKQKHNNGSQKSYILQKYIEKPLLYKNRKFDIRHYVLLTRFHGRLRAYFYGEGYIRTSSHQFKLDQLDQMIHLTNDAIQKYGDSYGKHQDGNKVSYTEFQRYLDSTYGQGKYNFSQQIYPKMKNIALDSIKATYLQLDPKFLQHNFELLGLDFMIDNKFNVWLIQVNTNPCLQLSSKLLERLIPQMAQNTIRICIDPMFPPSTQYPNSLKHMCPDNPLQRLQYELIFDQARDGKELQQLFKKCNLKQLYREMGEVDQEDATFQNQGKQIQFKNQKAVQENQ